MLCIISLANSKTRHWLYNLKICYCFFKNRSYFSPINIFKLIDINLQNLPWLFKQGGKTATIIDSCLRPFTFKFPKIPIFLVLQSFTMPCTFWYPDTCKRWKSNTSLTTQKQIFKTLTFPEMVGTSIKWFFSQIKCYLW